ncbi:DUF3043 domain-containing protein [Falsarthrobacter nasiphocae]|uniref:DUF3043 domain-containing protein n=1 Tax=Falsarthrobacter nasiphocae TaxID=189863 RepID=A0AAE4C5H7_9MICC|nr:DUF3043 domain-containing protein [Falsarthrobacter nasiphocae]MDR6891082.1 hypothetical protein [Falsarthrobacter nasiphocae]
MFRQKKTPDLTGSSESEPSTPATHGSTAAPAAPSAGTSPAVASAQTEPSAPQRQRHPQEKKGVRTPTRKEREAARKRPLVTDPDEAKRQRREARAREAEKMREALKTGDERHLPLKHRGPNRRLIRKVVDERFRISELLMFVTLPFLVVSLVFASNLELQRMIGWFFYAYVLVIIVEFIFLTRQVRARQAAAGMTRQPGDVRYIIERAILFRKMRLPAVGV